MGEYLRLLKSGHPFDAPTQQRYFEIGGVRVNGQVNARRDGTLEFLVRTDLNSKEVLARSTSAMVEGNRRGSLSVGYPAPEVFRRSEEVSIGFLTAGYLMWFRELGYSWALQTHLAAVRSAISKSSSAPLAGGQFSAVLAKGNWKKPWTGTAKLAGELALVAGIADRIVFFPPADCADLYARLPKNLDNATVSEMRAISFYDHHSFGGPVGVSLGNRLLIAPDVFFKGSYPLFLFFPEGGAQILYPDRRTPADMAKFKATPGVVGYHMDVKHLPMIPRTLTGAPTGGVRKSKGP